MGRMYNIQSLYLVFVVNCISTSHGLNETSINQRSDSIGSRVVSSCRLVKDRVYHGILVDCQGQGLTEPPVSLPPDTTTLLLQSNSISGLEKDSFVTAPYLKCLALSHNKIQYIHPLAFRSNQELVYLDLESNSLQLDNKSFPGGVFKTLHNLEELRLGSNQNEGVYCGEYSANLLEGLMNLRTLTIDTFFCDLDFGHLLFQHTKNLSSLTITGGAMRIMNNSFEQFDTMKLKTLTIVTGQLRLTEQGAYRYLKYLESLTMKATIQGVSNALESLAPLTNQNLTSLIIESVNDDRDALYDGCDVKNSALTPHMTRFLTSMCIRSVSLRKNNILFVESGSFSSGIWPYCLMDFDISNNPISGSGLELARVLSSFQVLRSFIFTNRKYSQFFKNNAISQRSDSLQCRSDDKDIHTIDKTYFYSDVNDKHIFHSSSENQPIIIPRNNENPTQKLNFTSRTKTGSHPAEKEHNSLELIASFSLPRDITVININGVSSNFGSLNVECNITGGHNLIEFHASDCGIEKFTARIHGIDNLRVLDISKNDASIISCQFIESVPKLFRLNMSDVNLNNQWVITHGNQFFQKLPELISLDLSGNNLVVLTKATFRKNENLRALGLARNRFKSIPSDINLLPYFCLLDMSHNAILRLEKYDMKMLDTISRRLPSFSLRLEGNVFSCGCSSIHFLKWLYQTYVYLDYDRNYSCILETGELTTTYQMKDPLALWRNCYGKFAFLISLVIASLFVFGFFMIAVGMKFEIQLKAYVLKHVRKGLAIKKPSDYTFGVYLSYSDNDLMLACTHLRHFIENRLRMSTYLRHRDLLPASDMAESIVSAINSSWRVILVITDHYFQDPWSFLAIKTAIYSVHAANPKRIVVIFTSNELPRHPILTSVLNVVPEQNILYLTSSGGLNGEEQEALKAALFH